MQIDHVAVIIPFFQREPGILRSTLKSVIEQSLPENIGVHVFIIDDESPLPPTADLTDLAGTDRVAWSIHSQANAGPGGARNLGIDLAEAGGFKWIAFLDSDDSWHPEHLSDALIALGLDYEVYCCDNVREGSHESYHEKVAALRNGGIAIQSKASVIPSKDRVLGFPPGALASDMVATCLFHTSAVVLKTSALKGIRFDTEQRSAGEDHLFWIDLALAGPAIVLSWKANVFCGRGVNIFYGSFDWNSASTMSRVSYQLLMLNKLRSMPKAMNLSGPSVMHRYLKYRSAYSFLFIRNFLKGKPPSLYILRRLMMFDIILPIRIPFLFFKVLISQDSKSREW